MALVKNYRNQARTQDFLSVGFEWNFPKIFLYALNESKKINLGIIRGLLLYFVSDQMVISYVWTFEKISGFLNFDK